MMRTKIDPCAPIRLFREPVRAEYETLFERIFDAVSSAATEALSGHQDLFGDVPGSRSDIVRLLGQATQKGLREAVTPRSLVPLYRKLEGDLPCTPSVLAQRLRSDAARGFEEDLLFFALYGFRHGLTGEEYGLLPVNSVSLEYRVDPRRTRARLVAADLVLLAGPESGIVILDSVEAPTSGLIKQRRKKKDEVEESQWMTVLLTLGLPLLFECLKDLYKLIRDALREKSKPKIDQALEAVDDLIDHIDGELKESNDDIRELEEDIREEDDLEDKAEKQKELEEKKKEKKALEEAKDEANKAKGNLEDAKKELDKTK